jgi:hypothetical protein
VSESASDRLYWPGACSNFNEVKKMKKTYDSIARFVRWAVAGVVSFIVVLPALTSFTASHM